MGHAIFIEDAAETKNLIEYNCVINTRASDSLLNTDQSPASFWITHPDNIFRYNHAAGSARYGYWFDLQETSIGPSFDPNICPENSKLGEFRSNVAHSNGRYGLRIFHQLIPREKPCQGFSVNFSSETNPFGNNAPIIAEFEDVTSYKNNRNGVITERTAAVRFNNFKTADNKKAGIEFSETQFIPFDGYTEVIGGLVLGRSNGNREADINDKSPHGIIGPRSEWLRVDGTSFHNFDFNDAAALGDCSHCWHPASTDMGARTVSTRNLSFDDSTVTKRVRYQYPGRGIFWDMDGTLTGLGADSWAVGNWPHLEEATQCSVSDLHTGLICDNTVQVRQIYFDSYSPSHFDNMDEFVRQLLPIKETELKEASDDELDVFKAYIEDDDQFSQLWMIKKVWAAPFVTSYRYHIRWGKALDFDFMAMHLSDRWQTTDKSVIFHSKHIDVREEINFYNMDNGNVQIANMTYFDDATSGSNYVYNMTTKGEYDREFGWRASMQGSEVKNVLMEGVRCVNPDCDLVTIPDVPISDETKYWSNATTWPSGEVPTGGSVEVEPGENIIYDLEDSPVFDVVTVNGRLSFLDDKDYLPKLNLNAKHIFVRAGELLIGSADAPYEAQAQITLYGSRSDQ